uniref:Uncharacterized protein n=1 Tax=Zea mays TaxID=4577 RepID=A0A804NHQ5_MAIZE
MVRCRPRPVPGPAVRLAPELPDRRVPRRLRVGHRGAVGGPGDLRQEPRAGGDPLPLGHARRARVRVPGAARPQRRQVRRGGVVQGGLPDLQRGRAGLPRQPEPGPRAEHPGHLGVPGGAHGRRRGVPRRRRPARGGGRPAVPWRQLRPARARRRPGGVRRAQGEGDQERPPRHVLHVRLLRAGYRHRQGPPREPRRPHRRPRQQQRLGLRHQLRPRQVSEGMMLACVYRRRTVFLRTAGCTSICEGSCAWEPEIVPLVYFCMHAVELINEICCKYIMSSFMHTVHDCSHDQVVSTS